MDFSIQTQRLMIDPLGPQDQKFIFDLLNTPNWIQFIGDRKITSLELAAAYIQKILNASQTYYWVVRLKGDQTPIGLVTFLKRDYLEYYDIGFAFLPSYMRQGYAFESSATVMNYLIKEKSFKVFQATTLPSNLSSIQLLNKLGFIFEKQLQHDQNLLQIYKYSY